MCIMVDDLAEHRLGETRFAVQCADHSALVMFVVAASRGVVDGHLGQMSI